MTARLSAAIMVIFLCGCDNTGPVDAGADAATDTGVPDGAADLCAADSECGDQRLFCTRRRCMPGVAGADVDGCLDIGSPCTVGQSCDEESDVCGAPEWCAAGRDGCSTPGDCDGDGADAIECGGNDCDDADASRYPTNVEVCDAANVDEDCDPSTFGDTDSDGDSYVDAACCNGSVCGDDCDDDDSGVHPDASEMCNGQDMNCDGTVDNATSGSLCPGGLCVGGRCRADGWDRTWGGTGVDLAGEVAVDSMGNVYVAGRFQRTVSFGGTEETTSGNAGYLLSWAADGSYRWHIVTTGIPVAVAVDPTDQVILAGADIAVGFVETFDASGGSVWRRETMLGSLSRGQYTSISATGSGIVVGGYFSGSVDFGGGSRTGPAGTPTPSSAVVVEFALDGTYRRDMVIDSTGAQVRSVRVASDATSVSLAGEYSGGTIEIDGTTYTNAGEADLFVARFDRTTGAVLTHAAFTATGDVSVNGLAIDGASGVYIAGDFDGEMSFGAGGTETSPRGVLGFRTVGFVFALDTASAHVWHQTILPTSGLARRSSAGAIEADASGVLVAGTLVGTYDFGGGIRGGPSESTVYLASYAFSGGYRDDQAIRSTTSSAEGDVEIRSVATGPGGMMVYGGTIEGRVDLGSGRRTSAGSLDSFVVRLGS